MKKVAEKKPITFSMRAQYKCHCCGCCDCVEGCHGGELFGGAEGFLTVADAKAAAHRLYLQRVEGDDELNYEVIRIGPRGGFTTIWTARDGDDGELSFE